MFLQLFPVVWIFLRSPGLLQWVSSQWGSQNYFRYWYLMNSVYLSVFNQFLTQWIMVILSKGHNQITLNHTTLQNLASQIWGIPFNFFECESFLESVIFALWETNLDDSIDSGNFSVRGYLPLIRKDSSTHMHGLAVYVKEGLPFAWDLSLENSADSYLCFWLALLHSVSYFFFLYWSPSSLLGSFWFYFI